MISQAIY